MSTLYEDTLQKAGKHAAKHDWWRAHGVEVLRTRFDGRHGVPVSFGDYFAEGANVIVDSKRSLDEIAQNVRRDHRRFAAEADRAYNAGYRLVFLVENEHGYENLGDVVRWTNGHCAKCGRNVERHPKTGDCRPLDPHGKCPRHGTVKPVQGPTLYRALRTFSAHHLCRFEFCAPEESARRICELLGVDYDGE